MKALVYTGALETQFRNEPLPVVGAGESLEDIKAKLKPKKQAISAEMLDTANTYDDKVAVIRMIVADESDRVANVFKSMLNKDMAS